MRLSCQAIHTNDCIGLSETHGSRKYVIPGARSRRIGTVVPTVTGQGTEPSPADMGMSNGGRSSKESKRRAQTEKLTVGTQSLSSRLGP